MTIEIADRLIKLRKKYGYSQEELADKLGLSRQAVSKWERAEASPDTDNLICLAKLYGVSLDELLATDEDIDTIVEEQVKDAPADDEAPKAEAKKDDHIVINDDGIFVKSKNGSSVSITDDGIKCTSRDGKTVKKMPDKAMAIIGSIEAILCLLATVAYILLGALLGLWHCAWAVFFVPEIICSILRAIRRRNAQHFNMAFAVLFAFFFVCMWVPGLEANLWHPMWAVFFGIPLYHTSVGLINKAIGKVDPDDKDGDDDEDEDDD